MTVNEEQLRRVIEALERIGFRATFAEGSESHGSSATEPSTKPPAASSVREKPFRSPN